MPDAMFLRSRRRTRVASLPIINLSYDLNAAVMPAATPQKCE
jgi:hypothetical protein